MENGSTFYVHQPSPFGTVCIVWQDVGQSPRVVRIFLSSEHASAEALRQETYGDAARQSHPAIADLGQRMQSFLEGQPIAFDMDLMAWDACSAFQRRVLVAEAEIPRGWISTYGRIARHLGIKGGARAAGNALARNPFPLVIPCHRAIRSNGHLGGYQGGMAMKRALLELEGIEISEAGTVRSPRRFY